MIIVKKDYYLTNAEPSYYSQTIRHYLCIFLIYMILKYKINIRDNIMNTLFIYKNASSFISLKERHGRKPSRL